MNISILQNIIQEQKSQISYHSHNYTIHHKLLIYQAFLNLLNKFPEDFSNYLLNKNSRGFQHLLFQEYISLLEQSLPYQFIKAGKTYTIDSLLHEELNIFDGISQFEGIVSEKLEIKNNTQEFYLGGRKAKLVQPYYIGKLISLTSKDNVSLLNKVEGYSFSKIKVFDIPPFTTLNITHLRIPPHYQMGGMSYINRIRQEIVRQVKNETKKDSSNS